MPTRKLTVWLKALRLREEGFCGAMFAMTPEEIKMCFNISRSRYGV